MESMHAGGTLIVAGGLTVAFLIVPFWEG